MALGFPTRFLSYNERGIPIGGHPFLLNMFIFSLTLFS
nr:MAG TPA: hypothetical protein [Caudoviricetes sp.]DAR96982.1 MAG TPA: hypothetical protein [Caudoviricetes sp.]